MMNWFRVVKFDLVYRGDEFIKRLGKFESKEKAIKKAKSTPIDKGTEWILVYDNKLNKILEIE